MEKVLNIVQYGLNGSMMWALVAVFSSYLNKQKLLFYTNEGIKMVHKCPKMRENPGDIQHFNKTSTSSKQMINKTGIYMQMRTKESY